MENANCCSSWRQPKIILAVLGVVLVAAVLIVSLVRERIVNPPQFQVSITGQGKVYYQPDTAKVNLGVQVDKMLKASDALYDLNKKVAAVYDAVQKVGIRKENIITQNYSLTPVYDYVNNISQLGGYSANQTITIKITDLSKEADLVSKVIEAAAKAGVNQVNNIAFENSKINEVRQEARLKAINDAKSKAGVIASSLGVRLKKVVGWWENSVSPIDSSYYYDAKGGMGGGSASPVIPAGDQEMIMEVNISYSIK